MQRCARLCAEAGHAVAQVKLPERRPDSDVLLVKGGEDGKKRARVSKAAGAAAEGEGKVSFSLAGAKAPAP